MKENLETTILLAKLEEYRTKHLLHFVLTLLTGGLWAVVWVAVALYNMEKRQDVLQELGRIKDEREEV